METRTNDRRGRARLQAWALSGVLLLAVAAPARGDGVSDEHWQARPKAGLAVAGNSVWHAGSSASFGSLTGSFGLEFGSPMRSRRAGLFAAYRVTSGVEEHDALLAGGSVSSEFGRWRANATAAYVDPRAGAGHGLYVGDLQYRVAPEHRLGLEAWGRVGDGSPDLWLAYEGRVGSFLSLRLRVRLGADGDSGALARSEIVWRIR